MRKTRYLIPFLVIMLAMSSFTGCLSVMKKKPNNAIESLSNLPGATQTQQTEPEQTQAAVPTEESDPEPTPSPETTETVTESGSAGKTETQTTAQQNPGSDGQKLDSNTQYEANIFLSNFAEQYFDDYDRSAENTMQMAHFALRFCKINRQKDIEYKQWDGESYETLTLEQINTLTTRFFGVSFGEDEAKKVDGKEHLLYRDGRVGTVAGDGESYNRFVVVDSIKDDGGLKVATFTIYDCDDLKTDYYKMTPQEAMNAAAMSSAAVWKVATGTAVMKPYNNNGRATYQLLSYQYSLA